MKNLLYITLLLMPFFTKAQSGMTTIAGIGSYGCGGDGGSATSATLSEPWAMAQDTMGNIYFADRACCKIRKITPAGIISTIVGTGSWGFSGDGGPATAAMLGHPESVATDLAGNVFFVDVDNRRVRKVNAAGIVTTIAGTGANGFSGDGGAATLAKLNTPSGVAVDNIGNIYIADYNNNRIRKINSAGIISTVVGNGSTGFAGDGGPATAASLYLPTHVTFNRNGILYFSDGFNRRIRKIDGSGIISTVAGNGIEGDSGDGGPATLSSIHYNGSISFDLTGNMYLAQRNKIRKVSTTGIITSLPYTLSNSRAVLLNGENTIYSNNTMNVVKLAVSPYAVSDSLSVNLNNQCGSISFTISTKRFSPAFTIKTYFGDNSFTFSSVSNAYGSGYAIVNHTYSQLGLFVVKHVLFNGTVAIDSVKYSFQNLLCKTIPISFFYDANGNCLRDSATDPLVTLPIKVVVDSNSIPVDTVSCLSGFYYNATGNLNDIYSFRLLSYPAGLTPICPTIAGIVTDTLNGLPITHSTKYIGFNGITSPNFDLRQYSFVRTGRHMATGIIKTENTFCSPNYGIVTLKKSPRFSYQSSFPPPSSITPTSISWNITPLSPAFGTSQNIEYTLVRPIDSAWLFPGDTIYSTIVISPYSGDIDTQNNVRIRCDTVKSSYDPNKIDVLPKGNILNGTKLTYTIHFENFGNDTAHNIYVMDTLPPHVDPSTLTLVSASAVVNVVKTKISGLNIVKFDFPNIKLPDSSHHNQSQGMVVFTINTRTGLASGTYVSNHAGIFFDDNPVVMTDTAVNTIIIPSISISSASGIVICSGDTAHLTANALFVQPPHYRWKVNSTVIGSDNPALNISSLTNWDAVQCILVNSTGDTVIASSAPLVFTVNPPCPLSTLSLNTNNNIEVFPNPVNDLLTINTQGASYTEFEITNAIGQRIIIGQLNGANTTVDVKSLHSGVYQIRSYGSQGVAVRKFLKL